MEAETLDNLMTISVVGPSVETYDLNKAVLLWKGRKERRIFKKYNTWYSLVSSKFSLFLAYVFERERVRDRLVD